MLPGSGKACGERGGGVARFEVVPEEARLVCLIFAWVGRDRLELARHLPQAPGGRMPRGAPGLGEQVRPEDGRVASAPDV